MKNKILPILSMLILLIAALPFLSHAETPPDFGGDAGAPIDGGASLLVGAAAVYGARKLSKKSKDFR